MKTILIQFDTDPQPSTFDRVVAMDAGVDELFSYGQICPENVESLVHGAIFTRGLRDLHHTAIFVGGSQVAAGESLFEKVKSSFVGPMKVSIMMDSNGSNTTAAAAVMAASRHLSLSGLKALVLAGTGPVGHRVAQILASENAVVRVGSRTLDRAKGTCDAIQRVIPQAQVQPVGTDSKDELLAAATGVDLIVAAGAAKVELLPETVWRSLHGTKVLIDLNAVPPLGIGGVHVMDKAEERQGVICYGALGVGGTKMKIHKAAIGKLFESNNLVLDTAGIYAIGKSIG